MRAYKGFNTLLGTVFIFLAAAWLGGVLILYQGSTVIFQKAVQETDTKVQFDKVLANLIQAIENSFNEESQGITEFINNSALDPEFKISVLDHSAYLNLNWVRISLLQDTDFKNHFINQDFQSLMEFRFNKSPPKNIAGYAKWGDPKHLQTLFTTLSLPNINTTDEFMIEKLAGPVIRSKVRQLQIEKKNVSSEAELIALFASSQTRLLRLFSFSPEINVNSASEILLSNLLKYAPWKIQEPGTKTSQILNLRNSKYLTQSDLNSILQVEKTHPIYQYLGAKSTFFEITLEKALKRYRAVCYIQTHGSPGELKIKILENGWIP